MMKSSAVLLAFALAAASCSSVHVTTDHDESVDFSALRTFDWSDQAKSTPGPFGGNTLVAHRVTSAVERELTAKGLRRAEKSPDFLVALHATARDRLDVQTWPSWGPGWHRRRFIGGWGYERTSVSQWTEGSLVVDFVDPKSNDLLWRGTATSALDEDSGSAERVDAAVHELFEEFPPGGK